MKSSTITAGGAPGLAAKIHGHWSSRMGFLIAAVGSAVGLGNIWKFPYMVGQSGGAAFVGASAGHRAGSFRSRVAGRCTGLGAGR